jgi:hypothetical protein
MLPDDISLDTCFFHAFFYKRFKNSHPAGYTPSNTVVKKTRESVVNILSVMVYIYGEQGVSTDVGFVRARVGTQTRKLDWPSSRMISS